MNILITGGTGSGGSYLCEYLVKHSPDDKVIATSRWHSTGTLNNIEKIKDKITVANCDLTDMSNVVRMLEEHKPDVIYHMAATANVYMAFKTPLAVLNNNIFSTANLLEAMRTVCPKTVFQMCSTSEVIGTPKTTPIKEEHTLYPSNPYAVSKLASEKLSWAYWKMYQTPVIITRAFCYINPRRHDLFATSFALQIARIEAGLQKVLKHGNLSSVRSIMDVRDMCKAYVLATEKCEYGVEYNIGGTEPISVGDVLDMLIVKAKCPIHTEQNQGLMRPTDITNQVPDITRFQEKTGFKPTYTAVESIVWLLDEARETVRKEMK